jgi:DNA-binding PadR family transcriptional regulator
LLANLAETGNVKRRRWSRTSRWRRRKLAGMAWPMALAAAVKVLRSPEGWPPVIIDEDLRFRSPHCGRQYTSAPTTGTASGMAGAAGTGGGWRWAANPADFPLDGVRQPNIISHYIDWSIMPLPDLTHLQFLVLLSIGGAEQPGRYVREKLAKEGQRPSLPAFYQMMARLEEAKYIKTSTRQLDIDGQKVQERWYKVTAAGLKACHDTREFYRRREFAPRSKGGLAHA